MSRTAFDRDPETTVTFRDLAERQLDALCRAVDQPERFEPALELFDLMCGEWSERPIGARPEWPSDITDDGTPFEYSLAFGTGKPKVRLLSECQQAPFDARSNWDAALRLNQRLSRLPEVSLERFEQVQDLFAPGPGADLRFALWHAAVMDADGSIAFKVYLNPMVRGAASAASLVREALLRLGLRHAWSFLAERLGAGGGGEPIYFSLDLAPGAEARVKVYVAYRAARAAEIESRLEGCVNFTPGDAARIIPALAGQDGPFVARPILICYAFTSTQPKPNCTIHVPVRCYVGSDSEVLERACKLLAPANARKLEATVRGIANRPLESASGLVTYVSVRRNGRHLDMTTYLAPEAYALQASALCRG